MSRIPRNALDAFMPSGGAAPSTVFSVLDRQLLESGVSFIQVVQGVLRQQGSLAETQRLLGQLNEIVSGYGLREQDVEPSWQEPSTGPGNNSLFINLTNPVSSQEFINPYGLVDAFQFVSDWWTNLPAERRRQADIRAAREAQNPSNNTSRVIIGLAIVTILHMAQPPGSGGINPGGNSPLARAMAEANAQPGGTGYATPNTPFNTVRGIRQEDLIGGSTVHFPRLRRMQANGQRQIGILENQQEVDQMVARSTAYWENFFRTQTQFPNLPRTVPPEIADPGPTFQGTVENPGPFPFPSPGPSPFESTWAGDGRDQEADVGGTIEEDYAAYAASQSSGSSGGSSKVPN